jgi:hypothetical protein
MRWKGLPADGGGVCDDREYVSLYRIGRLEEWKDGRLGNWYIGKLVNWEIGEAGTGDGGRGWWTGDGGRARQVSNSTR